MQVLVIEEGTRWQKLYVLLNDSLESLRSMYLQASSIVFEMYLCLLHLLTTSSLQSSSERPDDDGAAEEEKGIRITLHFYEAHKSRD